MNRFVGVWKLQSFAMSTKSGVVKFSPLGKNPHGTLIYTENGYMSVHLSKENRKPFSSQYAMLGIGKKAEVNDTIRNYVAYCGTFSLEGNNVIHHKIDSHLIPNELGKDYIRYYKFENERLILDTAPMKIGVFSLIGSLVWKKYEA